MKCPIPGCKEAHRNQFEHFESSKAVTKITKKPNIEPKKVAALVTKITKSNKERVYSWREKNRKKYNAYMREYMKRKVLDLPEVPFTTA